MALLKSIEIANTGVNAEYWRIDELKNIRTKTSLKANVVLCGYANKAAADAGKAPLHTAVRNIAVEEDGLTNIFAITNLDGGNLYDRLAGALYDYVKANVSEFLDAQDV